jgi:hypothetical protein
MLCALTRCLLNMNPTWRRMSSGILRLKSGRSLLMFQRCLLPPSSIALILEAANTSEMSVNFYQTTWHNIPGDCHLYTRHHENLKSHKSNMLTLCQTVCWTCTCGDWMWKRQDATVKVIIVVSCRLQLGYFSQCCIKTNMSNPLINKTWYVLHVSEYACICTYYLLKVFLLCSHSKAVKLIKFLRIKTSEIWNMRLCNKKIRNKCSRL